MAPVPPTASAPPPGKYRLVAELGRGGMADVYLAALQGPSDFHKLVVVKLLRQDLETDDEFLTMFLDEARLAARLNHPNVVQTYEVGEWDRRPMIVMEYLDGQPLSTALARARSALPLGLHVRVLIEALAGLHHAHELTDFDGTPLRLVHRDMSPHNVFVTFDGQVKILDFGIAKAATSSAETRTGVLKGKLHYMAPEQMRAEGVDRRGDVFSVGVMLWEAIAGARMWRAQPDVVIMHNVVNGEMPDVASLAPGAPEPLARACRRALARDPSERYATAHEMMTDLEQWLEAADERATARDLGRWLSELFADARKETRAVVEAQLARARPTTASPPSLGPRAGGSLTPSGSLPRVPAGRAASEEDAAATVAERPSLARVRVAEPGETGSGRATSASVTPHGRGGRSLGLGLAGLAALVAVVGGALAVARTAGPPGQAGDRASAARGNAALDRAPGASGEPAEVAPPAEGSAGAEHAATGSAGPAEAPRRDGLAVADLVELRVAASPADARLYLDDAPLDGNPSVARVPRTDAARHLRAEARGFQPKTAIVVPSKDLAVVLALDRAPAAATGGAPPAAGERAPGGTAARASRVEPRVADSPAPSPAGDTAGKKPGKPPARKLDATNPWD